MSDSKIGKHKPRITGTLRLKPTKKPELKVTEDDPKKMTPKEAFAKDWTRKCDLCDETPVVNASGMCGPCTFGEADTVAGNW